jgi:Putative beta-barrel porin-2, OmpL-like. bbp2
MVVTEGGPERAPGGFAMGGTSEDLPTGRPRPAAWAALAVAVALGWSPAAFGQTTAAEPPKTFFEEVWFAYVENSGVFNLRGDAVDGVNELRFYDVDRGYTFNMAEISLKKEPSDRYPFGFGLVLTGGDDVQFNHAIGIFRDEDDTPADTEKFDLQEAYLSYKVPVGSGLTLKGGKFVTLIGYEVIESPNNLNFSRSFLFTFATPLTHVGLLASYLLPVLLRRPPCWTSCTSGSSWASWPSPGPWSSSVTACSQPFNDGKGRVAPGPAPGAEHPVSRIARLIRALDVSPARGCPRADASTGSGVRRRDPPLCWRPPCST